MTFSPGLQTHFNAPVAIDTLDQVRAFGFQWVRMDCQTMTIDTMIESLDEVIWSELNPLPIVYDLDRLKAIGAGLVSARDVEWGNEPDGDIFPSTYRANLEAACEQASRDGVRLWAPAISNLDRDSLNWLAAVRGSAWPEGLYGISVHRYGDGTFETPHDGFSDRADEVRRLLELCDGRPFIVTEFGYPTGPIGLTETQQAIEIDKEWAFWRQYTDRAFLYQINDGPGDDERYGIRRCLPDGTLTDWKPAAYHVPKGEPMSELASVSANTVFAKEDLIELDGRPGEYGLRCPPGADTILSPKSSGHHELRDMGALGGPDETCKVAGDLVYFPMNSQGGRFAWRLAE